MTTLESPTRGENGVIVDDLDENAVIENLDRLAKRFLDISGQRFVELRAHDKLGELAEKPGFSTVLAVASLLD